MEDDSDEVSSMCSSVCVCGCMCAVEAVNQSCILQGQGKEEKKMRARGLLAKFMMQTFASQCLDSAWSQPNDSGKKEAAAKQQEARSSMNITVCVLWLSIKYSIVQKQSCLQVFCIFPILPTAHGQRQEKMLCAVPCHVRRCCFHACMY